MFNPVDPELKVTEVQSLDSLKGSVANNLEIFIDRNVADKELFDFLATLEVTPESRAGELYLSIYDEERNQAIKVHSRKKIPLDKALIDRLESMAVRYKVFS